LFWSDELRSQVSGSAIERLRDTLPDTMPRWHPFNRGEYLEAKTLLPSYLLSSQGDRMLMANSVEGRFPFLDHGLIEFANELHPRYKMRVLREKHLLKQAMRSRLPKSTIERHKQPYRAPDAAAFLGDQAPDYVTELMGKRALTRHGYFDADKVSLLVNKLRKAKVAAARDNMAFVAILSTQIWHARFVAGEAVE
jgi:asparagine synthase (glutamine-hydrolysing)